MMPCGFPSLRQRWTRCDRPRAFCSVTTHDPCCTGLRSTRRQPCPTTEPAPSGLSSSQGGGELATEAAGGGSAGGRSALRPRSEEHTSELQSRRDLVCRLLLEKKKQARITRWQARRRRAVSPPG